MNDDKPHSPQWMAGAKTTAMRDDQSDAERLAHMTYGQLVKHFGLGSTHTFSSWDKLPEEERKMWVAAMSGLQAEMKEREELAPQDQSQSQSH